MLEAILERTRRPIIRNQGFVREFESNERQEDRFADFRHRFHGVRPAASAGVFPRQKRMLSLPL
jgi:hypothetical protein